MPIFQLIIVNLSEKGNRMTDILVEASKTGVTVTDFAAAKIRQLLSIEGRDDLRFRVKTEPGGCAGLKYSILFSDFDYDGDVIEDLDGFEIVVDKMSIPYLEGAVVNYEDTLQKQGFTVDNPNAQGTCACGDSFH